MCKLLWYATLAWNPGRCVTGEQMGQFLIGDEVLAKEGITDLAPYACEPGEGEGKG